MFQFSLCVNGYGQNPVSAESRDRCKCIHGKGGGGGGERGEMENKSRFVSTLKQKLGVIFQSLEFS